MNPHSSVGKIVFDFSTPPAMQPGWQIVNDDVMGGVSDGEFRLTKGVAAFSGHIWRKAMAALLRCGRYLRNKACVVATPS